MIPFLWPPTVLTGLIVLVGLVYIQYRKWKMPNEHAVIRINWESLIVRLFATAISISSVLVQASSVQPLSLLQEAGIGQLYITLGLLLSLGILVSNLKQKLDSFVMPAQKETDTEKKAETEQVAVSELLAPLRKFITRWESLCHPRTDGWASTSRTCRDLQRTHRRLCSNLIPSMPIRWIPA